MDLPLSTIIFFIRYFTIIISKMIATFIMLSILTKSPLVKRIIVSVPLSPLALFRPHHTPQAIIPMASL